MSIRMFQKICTAALMPAFALNLEAFANGGKATPSREEIANENLRVLFNISLADNSGPDKEFMDILQKYIFGEVFAVGDLDIKTRFNCHKPNSHADAAPARSPHKRRA